MSNHGPEGNETMNGKVSAGAVIAGCVQLGGFIGAVVGGVGGMTEGHGAVKAFAVLGGLAGMVGGLAVGCLLALVVTITQ
jgi:hypothetical protein